MKQADIRKICVLGAGELGNYIALESALAGCQVQLYDISLVALGRASEIQK